MSRLQEFSQLPPVHDAIEWNGVPPAVAVVRRRDGSRILMKRIPLRRIAEEVK